MVKHTQTIRQQIADILFECVWLFCEIDAKRVNYTIIDVISTITTLEKTLKSCLNSANVDPLLTSRTTLADTSHEISYDNVTKKAPEKFRDHFNNSSCDNGYKCYHTGK